MQPSFAKWISPVCHYNAMLNWFLWQLFANLISNCLFEWQTFSITLNKWFPSLITNGCLYFSKFYPSKGSWSSTHEDYISTFSSQFWDIFGTHSVPKKLILYIISGPIWVWLDNLPKMQAYISILIWWFRKVMFFLLFLWFDVNFSRFLGWWFLSLLCENMGKFVNWKEAKVCIERLIKWWTAAIS